MKLEIRIYKPTKRVYGNEYPVKFLKNGKTVHETTLFANDLKYVDKAYSKEFVGIKAKRV